MSEWLKSKLFTPRKDLTTEGIPTSDKILSMPGETPGVNLGGLTLKLGGFMGLTQPPPNAPRDNSQLPHPDYLGKYWQISYFPFGITSRHSDAKFMMGSYEPTSQESLLIQLSIGQASWRAVAGGTLLGGAARVLLGPLTSRLTRDVRYPHLFRKMLNLGVLGSFFCIGGAIGALTIINQTISRLSILATPLGEQARTMTMHYQHHRKEDVPMPTYDDRK